MELQYLQIYRFVYLQNIKSQIKCRITSIGGQMVFVRAFCRFFGHIAVSRCSPLLAGTFGSPGSSSKTVVTKQGKRLHKQLGQEETTNKKLKLFWVFDQKYLYEGMRLIVCRNPFAWAIYASLYGEKWSYKNQKNLKIHLCSLNKFSITYFSFIWWAILLTNKLLWTRWNLSYRIYLFIAPTISQKTAINFVTFVMGVKHTSGDLLKPRFRKKNLLVWLFSFIIFIQMGWLLIECAYVL